MNMNEVEAVNLISCLMFLEVTRVDPFIRLDINYN